MSAAATNAEELRVLLVEDTRADAELCLAELDRGGYRVTAEVVQNEQELRERLHLPFDVIISDYRLPGWTGMDAFHLLQSHGHPEPFLLATGTIGEELAVECLQQGVADFVLKDRLGRLPFAVRRAREAFFSRQQRARAEEGLRRAQEELELRVKQRTAELAAANAHLQDEIEERIRAKRYLESQYLITRITIDCETLEQAAPLILQAICNSFDWQVGGLWRLDAAAGVLRFVELWKQPGLDVEPLVEANRMRSFARGIGLPGGVWEAARPLWIADIMADDKFLRRQCVRSLGLHAALGFPILVRGEVAGIMEFFARDIREPAAPVMEFVYAVGSRIGLFMEHAAAREALRESEQRFRLLAEAVPQIIWTARPDGAIDYLNQRWVDYTGAQAVAPAKGWGWQQAVHADDLPLVLERWRQSLAAGATFECDHRLRNHAGEYLWHLGRAVPMRTHDGSIVKWFGSTTNIHDQKMAQQAQAQLVALRDDLVNNVSHALRTPLASLRGFSELMLAREFPPEKQREFLGIMHKESTRLSELINNFLDLQRMEAGRQMFHFEPLDLAALLKDRAVFFAGGSAQHRVRLEIPISLPAVRADGDRIHEVLNNLIANAIKYSPAGGEIVVGAREQGTEILLWVADHGIGIPNEALPHLFQKFYRVEHPEGRAISGTGLGLALVRQIVQMHKGRVWAESSYGEGSTFFVALPCERQVEAAAAEPATPSRDGQAVPPDILIVEDDRSFANLLREHFEGMGLSVGHTRFAEEALAFCRNGQPRMLLLDLHLAGAMDGWDLLVAMKHDDVLQKVPVVVMMGSDPNVHGLALGGADYVLKSATRESLLQAVRAQLVEPRGKRVLVADDDAVFRARLCHFLRSEEAVVIQAANGREALEKINEEVPDLLVLDLLMPELDGFEVLRRLRNDRRAVNLRTLVVTAKNLGLSEKAYLRRKLASMVGKGEADLDYFCQVVRRTLGVRFPKAQTVPAG